MKVLAIWYYNVSILVHFWRVSKFRINSNPNLVKIQRLHVNCV